MALNALFRPGPLESGVTAQFVERRHGRESAVSWHPWLDGVLSDTYQTVLFQEQAMAMAKIIAGFNDVEADKFRKGIGKKIPEVVEAVLKDFKAGAMKMQGLTPPPGYTGTLEMWVAELTEKLHGYARYMWNRGHSAGYGWITYITAFLEAHYPHEYYVALLDSYNKPSRLAALIRSILSVKLCKIVPPDVNESGISYAIGSDNNIYMGLAAIRSVGKSAAEIVRERTENGKFASFIEFCQRMPSVNKTAKVNLIKAGAFSWDQMLCDRDKIDNIAVIQKWAKKRTKKFDGSKVSPFTIAMKLEQVEGYDYTEIERNKNEKEVLHSFITGHPAAVYQNLAQNLERGDTRVIVPSQVKFDDGGDGCEEGETVLVVGMVDFMTRKMTREKLNNDGSVRYPSRPFLTVSISDNEGYTITNIWHPLCDDIQKVLVEGEIAMFECVVKKDKFREDFVSLHVKNAINLAHGLPIQGVFRLNGYNPEDVVERIGGMVQQTAIVGARKYSSIRGRISVMPDVLDKVVKECGDDVSYLISMDVLDV
jgi:DNA polymerase-3 subunit alpha